MNNFITFNFTLDNIVADPPHGDLLALLPTFNE